MTAAANVLRDARVSAGLSIRELAGTAGVAASSIVRIESGRVDPTVGMLARLLRAAGHGLMIDAERLTSPRIADLSTAWQRDADGQPRPKWTTFRAFLDHLRHHPELIATATSERPASSGSRIIDNLLAGIAEKVRDDAGLPRPTWTRRIAPSGTAWISPGTPRMQQRARAATPPQFAERNIVLAAESLWRDD